MIQLGYDLLKAFHACKPAPAYVEMHPRAFYELLNDPDFSRNDYNKDEPKFANVPVRTSPFLTGWRVVARPYDSLDLPLSKSNDVYEPLPKPVHVQSDDFDETARIKHEADRRAYERRKYDYYFSKDWLYRNGL